MKAYLAGACHFNDDPSGWRDEIKRVDIDGIEWVDPLDRYDGDTGEEMEPWEVIDGDLRQVRDCEIIVTRRFPHVESWGTVIETWEASRDGNFVLLISPPESKAPVWARGMADRIVGSLDEAVDLLREEAGNYNPNI